MANALTNSARYRILCARDRRFDGKLFFGVKTTGIYCRPICPARTPLERNVVYFASAAAAEEAGLRACLRCRPETSPGTPAWLGTCATVSRALRLMSSGAADERSLPEIAQRLGVTERHLRRLFVEHVGAPPLAVMLVRRLDFARQLVDHSCISFSEIAFTAGFGSVRRFNSAYKQRFRRSPTQTRALRTGKIDAVKSTFPLSYRPPIQMRALFDFLKARAIAGAEFAQEAFYRRTFNLGSGPGYFEIRPDEINARVLLTVSGGTSRDLVEVVRRVRGLLDLEADPLAVANHLGADPILRPLLKARPGLRVPGCWDGFELAVRAILGQQVSVAGARTLARRVVEKFGEKVAFENVPELTHVFPSAQRLARADLSGLGITGSRVKAIPALAKAVCEKKVRLDVDADPAQMRTALLELPGIGPWTTEYIALRALRDPNAFPDTDLVLKRAIERHGVQSAADTWQPWRAYAAHYLWDSL